MRMPTIVLLGLLCLLLTGCVTTSPYDYAAFRESNPRSILVEQVINSTTDRSYQIAGMTSGRLLSSGAVNGVLPGPQLRSQQGQ